MKDMHNSVIPYCDILARVEKLTEMYPEMDKENYSNCYNSLVFLRTQKGSDLLSKTNDMASFFKGFYWPYERDQVKDVVVVPLRKAYFIEKAQYSMLENGDWDFVIILISVGIVILFFAIINYVNLTVANRIQSQGSRYPQPVGFYEKRTFYPINPRIYPFKPSILLNRFILGHFSHSIRKSIVRGSY